MNRLADKKARMRYCYSNRHSPAQSLVTRPMNKGSCCALCFMRNRNGWSQLTTFGCFGRELTIAEQPTATIAVAAAASVPFSSTSAMKSQS